MFVGISYLNLGMLIIQGLRLYGGVLSATRRIAPTQAHHRAVLEPVTATSTLAQVRTAWPPIPGKWRIRIVLKKAKEVWSLLILSEANLQAEELSGKAHP